MKVYLHILQLFILLISGLTRAGDNTDAYQSRWLSLTLTPGGTHLHYEKKLPEAVTRELLSLPAISAALKGQNYPDNLSYLLAEPEGVRSLNLCAELFPGAHALVEQTSLQAGDSTPLPGPFRPHCSTMTLTGGRELPFPPLAGQRETERYHLLMLLLERKAAPGAMSGHGVPGSSDNAEVLLQGGASAWFPGYDDRPPGRRFIPADKAFGEPFVAVFFNLAALLAGQPASMGLKTEAFDALNTNDDRLLIRLATGDGQQQLFRFGPDQAAIILDLAAEEGAHSELLWYLAGKGEVVAQSAEPVSQAELLAELNTITGLLSYTFSPDGKTELPPGVLSCGGVQSKSSSGGRSGTTSSSSRARGSAAARNRSWNQQGATGGSGEPPEDDRPSLYSRLFSEHYAESSQQSRNERSGGNDYEEVICTGDSGENGAGGSGAGYYEITGETTAPARVVASRFSSDASRGATGDAGEAPESGQRNRRQILSRHDYDEVVFTGDSGAHGVTPPEVAESTDPVLARLDEITTQIVGLSQQVGSLEKRMLAQNPPHSLRTTRDATTQTEETGASGVAGQQAGNAKKTAAVYAVVDKTKKRNRQSERMSTTGTGLQIPPEFAVNQSRATPTPQVTAGQVGVLTVDHLNAGEDMIESVKTLAKNIHHYFGQKALEWRKIIATNSVLWEKPAHIDARYFASEFRVSEAQLREYYTENSQQQQSLDAMEAEFTAMFWELLRQMAFSGEVIREITSRGPGDLNLWLNHVITTGDMSITRPEAFSYGLASASFLKLLFSSPEHLGLSAREAYRDYFSELINNTVSGLSSRQRFDLAYELRRRFDSGDLQSLRTFWTRNEGQLIRSLLIRCGSIATYIKRIRS